MNEKVSKVVIHLVVIVMIFILPEVVASGSAPRHIHFGWMPYAKVAIFLVVFYLEYMLMRPTVSRTARLAGTLCLVAGGWTALYLLMLYAHSLTSRPHPQIPMMIRDLAFLMLTAGLSVAVSLTERLRNIEEANRREELKQLKSQLNPHFLFNSLNTVYALTEVDPEEAKKAVHSLSTLLRYALYEADSSTVKLKREVAFVEDYVGLMQARLGNTANVSLTVEIDPAMEEAEIAPMMFVTLVENAFKHGGSSVAGSYVAIRITASASGDVECDVANSIAEEEKKKSGGVGLENLRRRLTLIYGKRGRLEISHENSIFVAQLRIKV